MKHLPRTIESLRTIGHLRPTTQRNTKRHTATSEDRFTLCCIVVAVLLSALIVALEA